MFHNCVELEFVNSVMNEFVFNSYKRGKCGRLEVVPSRGGLAISFPGGSFTFLLFLFFLFFGISIVDLVMCRK